MRVLVLGSNGQLGTDIMAEGARRRNFQLQGLTRADLDLEDVELIPQVLGQYPADVFVNCTGYHKTDEVEQNATRAVGINAHAVEAIASVAAERQIRFIHISTDYVFDGTKDLPYTEDDTPAPINVYGATKYLGETLAFRAHADTMVLRVASLFGVAGASGKGGNFVETMQRLARERGELRVVDDVRMSPTATDTVTRVLLDLLEEGANPGLYHTVNSGHASWYEFASEIIKKLGWDTPVHPTPSSAFPTQAHRPAFSVLDNAKVERASGQEIEHWEEALSRYFSHKTHMA